MNEQRSLFTKDGQLNKGLSFEQQSLPKEQEEDASDHYCGKEIFRMRNALQRKFSPEDVRKDPKLMRTAEWFATEVYNQDEKHWSFRYMKEMQTALAHYGTFTDAQAKGVLNVMYSIFRTHVIKKRVEKEHQDEEVAIGRELANGYYTVVADDKHWTFRISEGFRADREDQVVGILIGPDNTSAYANFAFIEDGKIQYWQRAKSYRHGSYTISQAWKDAMEFLLGASDEQRAETQQMYAKVSGNCYVCGRALTHPESIALGIGPECRKKRDTQTPRASSLVSDLCVVLRPEDGLRASKEAQE